MLQDGLAAVGIKWFLSGLHYTTSPNLTIS